MKKRISTGDGSTEMENKLIKVMKRNAFPLIHLPMSLKEALHRQMPHDVGWSEAQSLGSGLILGLPRDEIYE